ncbi:uncharacterized protein CDAR_502921 [Caerostris darwini]|uniref:Uncharacterized protein n=1 Tax=Caerostris darwini TaxID=1538125 RepID=A0AAV4T5B4_9ARAC|nr:uncharacterized protein CDAR_502921 [Caerostris darwini]
MLCRSVIINILFSLPVDSQSSQLYLQPVKNDHAYFTGDNFFVTCFTTEDNIEKLTWTDFESNPISTNDGSLGMIIFILFGEEARAPHPSSKRPLELILRLPWLPGFWQRNEREMAVIARNPKRSPMSAITTR